MTPLPPRATEGFVLDLKGLKAIEPSGFVPPRHRRTYIDPQIQEFLQSAFGGLFPSMQLLDESRAQYHHLTGGAETCSLSRPASSLDEIPRGETHKIVEGWIALQKEIMEASSSEGIRSLLLNLRIPDPRRALHCYRLYDKAQGGVGLHIVYGFESGAMPSVPVQEALATLLGIKLEQVDSLLFTSMKQTGPTPLLKKVSGDDTPATAKTRRRTIAVVSAIAIAVAAVAIGTWAATANQRTSSTPSPSDGFVTPANSPVTPSPIRLSAPGDSSSGGTPAASGVNLDAMIK